MNKYQDLKSAIISGFRVFFFVFKRAYIKGAREILWTAIKKIPKNYREILEKLPRNNMSWNSLGFFSMLLPLGHIFITGSSSTLIVSHIFNMLPKSVDNNRVPLHNIDITLI